MKGYNTLLGSHYDHYIVTYSYYGHEDIDNDVFEVPESEYHQLFELLLLILFFFK